MASTRFSAGLVSLYPREGDELQLMLEEHHVAHGRPEAIDTFVETLTGSPALQSDLAGFVAKSRSNPRGPVSRGAMLHLLLTNIGGPDAVYLGPEADGATNSITLFLEQLGGWPEDAFADLGDPGSEDGFGSRAVPQAAPSANGGRPRSIAASLASQNGHHLDGSPADASTSSLEQIVLALGRLEETHRATSAKLDQIDTRLRRMEDVGTEAPAPALGETPPAPETNDPADFIIGAKTIIPTPILSQLSHPPADGILEAAEPSEFPAALAALPPDPQIPPAIAQPVETASSTWTPPADPLSTSAAIPLHTPQPDRSSASAPALSRDVWPVAAPAVAATPSAREWKEIFSVPPEKPKRTVALVPVVIACLILAAAIVAGLIYFLHNEGATPEPVSDTAPAPSLSEPASEEPAITSNPAPRTAQQPSRTSARPETAQNTRPESPSTTPNRQDRVLGARESYPPRSSAEVYPQPRQPSFVAASTMESRLVYAPPPQHPRIAGLVGLTGMVVMEVVVDSDGTVETVKVLGGHHLLRDAAVNAVRTWRYRPVLQNGRPVPIRTIVRMDFNKDTSQAKN